MSNDHLDSYQRMKKDFFWMAIFGFLGNPAKQLAINYIKFKLFQLKLVLFFVIFCSIIIGVLEVIQNYST